MSARNNLWVDITILIGFLVIFEPALTGIAIHEWLSLAFTATIVLHLLLHWAWTVAVTRKFFNRLWHSSRLNYVLDLSLLVAFVTVMLSGILISRSVLPALGLAQAANPAWRFLHSSSADAMLIIVGLHIALHWKWIISTCQRYLFVTRTQRVVEPSVQSMPFPLPEKKNG